MEYVDLKSKKKTFIQEKISVFDMSKYININEPIFFFFFFFLTWEIIKKIGKRIFKFFYFLGE